MPDFLQPLVRHVLYPLYYWRNKDARLQHLRYLEAAAKYTPEALNALRLHRLQRLLNHAQQHVPFYRERFAKAGFNPRLMQRVEDIQQLPCLTKADIQQHGQQLLSEHCKPAQLMRDSSGGSTGEPTHYYKDRAYHQLRAVDQIRHDRFSGWDIGQPYALIWGSSKDLSALSSLKQQWVTRWIHRCYPLDAFDMQHDAMLRYMRQLERVQPVMILGYANALAVFADFLAQHFPKHNIRPKGIISSAEALSEAKRQRIESVFACKVLNRYGSREVGLIASECSAQQGLHINADNLLVEVLDDQGKPVGPGELGELVVTDFHNFAMPFIRYRLGDMGSFSDQLCACGRNLPLLQNVQGRVSDFLTATDGRLIHGEYFTHMFYGQDNVKKFQLIQETLTQVTLKLVLKDQQAVELHAYRAQIQQALGQTVTVDIQLLEHIPPAASGKFLFTQSKVGAYTQSTQRN